MCKTHPDVASGAVCSNCLDPLCGECIGFFRGHVVCRDCAPALRAKRNRSVLILAGSVTTLVLTAIVVVVVLIVRYVPPYDYGRDADLVASSKAKLAGSPCDRAAAIDLADAMAREGDAKGTLLFADKYFDKCGDEPRILWATYTAHKQLGEWAAAADDATKLIESEPEDKDYRWWRAIVRERKGDLAGAATDYEKSIELEPRLTNIPINLASLYEKMKKPCEAGRTLDAYIERHPEVATQLKPRATALDARCSDGR